MQKKELEELLEEIRTAGGLANHDILNKIVHIILRGSFIEEKSKDKEVLDLAREIRKDCRAIENIVRNFGEFLKETELKLIYVESVFEDIGNYFSRLKLMKVKSECKGLKVLADVRLRMIFYNLIENSLKYGGKNLTEISLSCEEKKDGAYITYKDNGQGIAISEKEKVFEANYGEGTGMGLYLIKNICRSYGWKIREKGIPKKGVEFEIFIPKTNPKPQRKIP